MTMPFVSSCCGSDVKMAAMKLNLILCILLGLFAASSAARQYQVDFQAKSGYPHAGLVKVYIDGSWGTICANDWDMNDAEVVCRDLGKGFVNTITVSGGPPSGSGAKCLSSVRCYGHERRLSDCEVTKTTRSGSSNDKGIVCFPPTSDARLRLRYGPDQYSGWVEVKLADGTWGELYIGDYSSNYPYTDWSRYQYIPNICRQLGFGELNWWDVFDLGTSTTMTHVYDCAYGVAHHASCTFSPRPTNYQAFVGCHKPGSIKCSAPYIPKHASVEQPRLNYAFGDRINVTCDTSDDYFPLQCHNKGLWSGPSVSCPTPTVLPQVAARHAYCSAPAVPPHSTNQNLRLSYKDGDRINVTCDVGPDSWPLSCEDGIWIGQNIVCPVPIIECNPPIIPAVSSVKKGKSRYKVGEEVNITCNAAFEWVVWECHSDGMWRGMAVVCPDSHSLSPGAVAGRFGRVKPVDEQNGRELFTTGLLVAAVIMFVLVLMSMVAFSISFKGWRSVSSKELEEQNADRGPLPDVPTGYAEYLVGDRSLYTEPYIKQSEIPHGYETYEKPV